MQINMLNMAQFEASNASNINAKAKVAASYGSKVKALEAAETFEAIFISQMLAPMFETVPKDSMFGGGHAEQIYNGMQIEEYGKTIASGRGLGIKESIFAEILKHQEFAEDDI